MGVRLIGANRARPEDPAFLLWLAVVGPLATLAAIVWAQRYGWLAPGRRPEVCSRTRGA